MRGTIRAGLRWPGMLRAQWLRPEALERLQAARLGRLVRHAYAHSALYRRRFDEAGLQPGDIRTIADLRRLPVTTREDLRDPDALLARGHDPARLHRSMTSGSTGRRTTSYFDEEAWVVAKILLKLRARLACGVRPWDRVAICQEVQAEAGRGPGFKLARSFSIHDPIDRLADRIAAFAPTVLFGFPGHLARLGEAAAGRLRPRLVFTTAELLDGHTRRRIERGFAAPVRDVYGCTEAKEVAWQCPVGDGYHVNADWLVCEIDTGGRPGGPGRILLTPLFNLAMPLLRYEVGDSGEAVPGVCPCGRGLPLIRPVWGRSVDYLQLADGSWLTPYDLTCAIEHVPGFRQYQIVQRGPAEIDVRLLPDRDYSDATRSGIEAALMPVLKGLRPRVTLVDDFAFESSGKFRIVRVEPPAQ